MNVTMLIIPIQFPISNFKSLSNNNPTKKAMYSILDLVYYDVEYFDFDIICSEYKCDVLNTSIMEVIKIHIYM